MYPLLIKNNLPWKMKPVIGSSIVCMSALDIVSWAKRSGENIIMSFHDSM